MGFLGQISTRPSKDPKICSFSCSPLSLFLSLRPTPSKVHLFCLLCWAIRHLLDLTHDYTLHARLDRNLSKISRYLGALVSFFFMNVRVFSFARLGSARLGLQKRESKSSKNHALPTSRRSLPNRITSRGASLLKLICSTIRFSVRSSKFSPFNPVCHHWLYHLQPQHYKLLEQWNPAATAIFQTFVMAAHLHHLPLEIELWQRL